jgi:hypothetical protein
MLLAACSAPGGGQRASPSRSPGATASHAALQACLDQPAPPAAPAGVRTAAPAWVLAAGLDQPDDLLFRNGQVLVGELGSGHLATVAPGLPLEQSTWSVPMAEGIAFIGSREFVADQKDDRVVEIIAGVARKFLQLQPVAGKDNLDGLATQNDVLLVPDSPHGNLLWVSGNGQVTRTLGGFTRPTGAWPLPDGSLLVADEDGGDAVKIAPDGTRTFLVQGLPIVDDVAADSQGRVFVVTPVVSGGRLAELVGGKAVDLAGGLLAPQGLGFDGADNALVTESAAGRLDLLIRTFKLVPSGSTPAAGQPLCVHLQRAPGFTADVHLDGKGWQVLGQPGAGDVGEILAGPGPCPAGGCSITASSGTLTDTLWITR